MLPWNTAPFHGLQSQKSSHGKQKILFFFVCWLFLFAVIALAPAQAGEIVLPEPELSIHGFINAEYRFRATNLGQRDHDLYQTVALDVGDPYLNHLTAHFLGGYIADLDGHQNNNIFVNPLGSIYDGFNQRIVPRIYYAYVDWLKPFSVLEKIRLGRQQYYDFEMLYFDGVKMDSKRYGMFRFNAFGGIPVNNYESVSGWDPGDWLGGAGVEAKPYKPLKLNLDYVHIHDNVQLVVINGGLGNYKLDADLVTLRSWYLALADLDLYTQVSTYTRHLRDASLRANWRLPDYNANVQFNYYTLLAHSVLHPFEIDNFTILGTQTTYHDFNLRASQVLLEHFTWSVGGQVRKLASQNSESAFNHEFSRAFLTLSNQGWPFDGTTLSASMDAYNPFGNSAIRTFAASGEVEQKFEKTWKFALGTSYALYKYNIVLLSDTNHVRDYYARLSWLIVPHLTWKTRYQFETSSLLNTHDVRTGLEWSF